MERWRSSAIQQRIGAKNRARFFKPAALLAIQLALGLLTGFLEGWPLGDAVYFTFITGLTIGYGDFVPRQTLTRALAIGIGFFGLFVTGVVAAIAVHAMRSALAGRESGSEHPDIDKIIE